VKIAGAKIGWMPTRKEGFVMGIFRSVLDPQSFSADPDPGSFRNKLKNDKFTGENKCFLISGPRLQE
jgi:hypothetical protein